MSFKLKTVLLVTVLAVTPFLVTVLLVGEVYRKDHEQQILTTMNQQLEMTATRLDQLVQSVVRDMQFVASLDVMNDVLTGDIDKRISNLLIMKKQDLHLEGAIDVVDIDGVVIASSDSERINTSPAALPFLAVPIQSTFSDDRLGELHLFYRPENLARLFQNHSNLQYALRPQSQTGDNDPESLEVSKSLANYAGYRVVLSQPRDAAFAIMDQLEKFFFLALVIAIVAIVVLGYLAADQIVEPIVRLAAVTKHVTQSEDYSQRVDSKRQDEVGQLYKAYNQMVSGMQDLIARLREESENRVRLAEEQQRSDMLQNLSAKLSRYLSPQIYEAIFSGQTDVTLGSSRKKLTVFFSDIVNFTGTTDLMESEDLTELLNYYLREMTEIALSFGATIDKYIGDAIMIFFGDPESEGVHSDALRCVQMASAMQERMKVMQAHWRSQGYTQPFAIRVGIHTGYCTVGNFGTEQRLDYTIIGSAVNLASRIESQAEPGTIFLSEDTWLLIRDKIGATPAGQFTPKGFHQPVNLYRVAESGESTMVIEKEGFHLELRPGHLHADEKAELKSLLAKLSDDV